MQNQTPEIKAPTKADDKKQAPINTPPLESDFETPHEIKQPKSQMVGRSHDDDDENHLDVDPREPAVKSCGTDSCGCGTGKKPH